MSPPVASLLPPRGANPTTGQSPFRGSLLDVHLASLVQTGESECFAA